MPYLGIFRYTSVCLVLTILATLGGSGCNATRPKLIAVKAPVTEAGLVFAVDGAGNFQASSQYLRKVIDQERLPVQVVTVEWSHGYGRIFADQIGYAYARAQGRQLALLIEQFRQEHPGVPVYLMAHSAGSAVAVTALENLPPDSVDRAIFLAPSLSAAYDIRPSLRAVKYGLHVFYSRRDTIYLGIWTGILGNSDRRWGPSSGRIGFQTAGARPEDASLYSKLSQRAWQPHDLDGGNDGKHYGDYQPDFVRLHVLPLLRNVP
jgi:pimeloyl-ACP methyl ester carboxylesterase